jgi:hypothetical protein
MQEETSNGVNVFSKRVLCYFSGRIAFDAQSEDVVKVNAIRITSHTVRSRERVHHIIEKCFK